MVLIMKSAKTVTDLVNQHGAKISKFKDIYTEAQYALIQYMAVDGEAWEVSEKLEKAFQRCWKIRGNVPWEKESAITKKTIMDSLLYYIDNYGDVEFGTVNLPIKYAKAECFRRLNNNGESFDSFNDYHKWFMGDSGVEKHSIKSKWPCILSDLSDTKDDLFQDGWHRFHRYVELKCRFIPCVFYA